MAYGGGILGGNINSFYRPLISQDSERFLFVLVHCASSYDSHHIRDNVNVDTYTGDTWTNPSAMHDTLNSIFFAARNLSFEQYIVLLC